MRASEYCFITTWRIEAPLQSVWDAIHDPAAWPQWWSCVERVIEVEAGADDGVGALHRYTWKGRLPYRVRFDMRVARVEPFALLEGEASGDVEGRGRWRFSSHDSVTTVRYEWRVRTGRGWMNLLAPIARPIFKWNHDYVMQQGGEALAKRLDARLVSIDHRAPNS
ncbi:SRPBCC family protein [Caballeronia ptereochthonis]|uniref:Polyketide cyclase n=1 Tax=Caballeronia ptereochthonis TaxID=1777144 RepID=A0A158C425_9BURK|nr:SRPBCC family protein [Caballeronia ptereochthonis]SAK77104.1 polyketide cyclase [Caballeronia ptereochthonis]